MSRSGEQRERPGIARRITRACNSGAIPAGPLRRWSQARSYRISGDLSDPLRHILGWGAERRGRACRPLGREPALGVTTMDYSLADSLARAEEQR
jgi:hypothetical protein